MALSALQAQNTVTVGEVNLKHGETAVISVELTNETAFTSFQMDLKLPEGFIVPTMINEDEEEVLDIALSADRKKSTHLLAYNELNDGAIRIASYSSTNATYKGNVGEIVQIRIEATDAVAAGNYVAELNNILFTTAEPVGYDFEDVAFKIVYLKDEEVVHPNRSVEVYAGEYGRCLVSGRVVEPNASCVLPAVEHGASVKLYFVPFEGYKANSMMRNGELVAIHDNMYEEVAVEDVVFAGVDYVKSIDTLVVTETDTLVVTETVVDTLILTETIVDTLVVTETIVEVDTVVVSETIVDTVLVETVDTVFVTEVEELPVPVITCENGVVTITCDTPDVLIFYAIDGSPLEGGLYTAPFEMTSDGVVSAVAIRCGEVATQYIVAGGVGNSTMRVVGCRYYTEEGIEVSSPEKGITIVSAEYEDGTKRVFKMVKK